MRIRSYPPRRLRGGGDEKAFVVRHIRFLFLVFAGIGTGLGGCSSAMDYTSAIGDREALRIGSAVTPARERNRLIRMLKKTKRTHRSSALREIEKR